MMQRVDAVLDRLTMYRATVYYLAAALLVAVGLSAFHVLPYHPLDIVLSTVFLLAVSWFVNELFSRFLHVHSVPESVVITALILALIIEPSQPLQHLALLGWAAVWAMGAKYLLAVRRKHFVNPAAFGVVVTSLVLGQSASWWVGAPAMLPVVLVGGLLLVRKLGRSDLLWAFFMTVAVATFGFVVFRSMDLLTTANELVLRSPLLFFGFVMLTEPSTMAPTHRTRLAYGALVGLLFTPYFHLGSYYFAPEVALLVGNLFTYAVSYRARVVLRLDAKDQIGPDTLSFRFKADRQVRFRPGQYLECTLPHEPADSRGHRRYFTIASAPTEPGLELGVKFYPQSSSFKSTLAGMHEHDQMFACQLAGDFTLPRDHDQKLAFVAGGIGITPFRSILKYLADTGDRRPVVLIYCVKSMADVVYRDVIDEARRKLGIRVAYVVFDGNLPPGAEAVAGVLTPETLRALVPDYRERLFYLSGPQGMVRAYEGLLGGAGVKANRIKTDYFPGFAA